MRLTALAVAALSLAACSPPAAPAPADASASVEELGQMNRDFAAAINAKDGALAASYYAEDAVVIPPGEAEVRGRAAIEAYWKGGIEAGGLRDVSVETMRAQFRFARLRGWQFRAHGQRTRRHGRGRQAAVRGTAQARA